MGSPTWELENDATTVTITFATEPPTRLKLDLAAVGDFLKALWSVRTAMMPEIVRELPPAPRWVALRDPIWFAERGAWDGDSLLHLRDPGYGWLHYLIPRNEAAKLARILQEQVDTPPPQPPSDKVIQLPRRIPSARS
jgi:hypothetical protein